MRTSRRTTPAPRDDGAAGADGRRVDLERQRAVALNGQRDVEGVVLADVDRVDRGGGRARRRRGGRRPGGVEREQRDDERDDGDTGGRQIGAGAQAAARAGGRRVETGQAHGTHRRGGRPWSPVSDHRRRTEPTVVRADRRLQRR